MTASYISLIAFTVLSALSFLIVAQTRDSRYALITGTLTLFICLLHLYLIRFDDYETLDMLFYHRSYVSDFYTNWHYKEFLFWYPFRLLSELIPIQIALLTIDVFFLVLCCTLFRFFGLKPVFCLVCGLLLFSFFPFIFGRLGAYRQYWALILGSFIYAYIVNLDRQTTLIASSKLWYIAGLIPVLIHNGAVVLLLTFFSYVKKSIGHYFISVCVFGVILYFFFNVDRSAGDLLLDKLVRERHSSGALRAEYIYMVAIVVCLYFLKNDYKRIVGGEIKLFAATLFVFYVLGLFVFQTTSVYLERISMYILVILFPLLMISCIRNPDKLKLAFISVLTVIPIFFPAIQIVVMGS